MPWTHNIKTGNATTPRIPLNFWILVCVSDQARTSTHTTSQYDPSSESRINFAENHRDFTMMPSVKARVGQDARTVYCKVTDRLSEVE